MSKNIKKGRQELVVPGDHVAKCLVSSPKSIETALLGGRSPFARSCHPQYGGTQSLSQRAFFYGKLLKNHSAGLAYLKSHS